MQYVAATDFSTRSNRAVRQAGLLARDRGANLHLVHVVDDDQPEELVRMERREAQRLLAEHSNSMPELRNVQCNSVVIAGDPFDGILRSAADVGADLIIMGSHRKQFLLDIFVGTTIERVIRRGRFPVLMVNNEAQRRYEKVVVPVDISDASVEALRAARTKGFIEERRATLLHAFVPFTNFASERQEIMDELVAFLVANDLGQAGWSLRVESGGPMEVISRAVAQMRPDLLVMGTQGRSAWLKPLISSVTEEALRSLNVDILAVPTAQIKDSIPGEPSA